MVVELIGPPGSGKTTLYKKISADYKDKELRYELACYFMCKKSAAFRLVTKVIPARLSRHIAKANVNSCRFDDSFYSDEELYAIRKIMSVKYSEENHFLHYFNWELKKIFKGAAWRNLNLNGVYLSDESYLSALSSMEFDGETLFYWPKPDKIVYVKCDPDVVAKNIESRKSKQLNRSHANVSYDELLFKTRVKIDRYETMLNQLEGLGVPVLYYDYQTPLISVQRFISSPSGKWF